MSSFDDRNRAPRYPIEPSIDAPIWPIIFYSLLATFVCSTATFVIISGIPDFIHHMKEIVK